MAWKLTASTLSESYDAGAHWVRSALPAGVSGRQVSAVAAAPGRGAWVAVARRDGAEVYHHTGAQSWSTAAVSVHPGLSVAGALPSASLTLGASDVIALTVSWGLSTFTAINRLFVSTDNGASFTGPRAAGTRAQVEALIFTDARHGLVSGGPTGAYSQLFRTNDGGATWLAVAIPDTLNRHQQAELDAPVVVGTAIELPVTVTDTVSDAQRVTVYASTDHGATFTTSATPLAIPPRHNAGYEPVAINGPVIWIPARGVIYESVDAGRHWTTQQATTQPIELGLLDASHAVGVIEDAGCRHYKSDCYDYRYLAATGDSGQSWHPI